MYKNYSFFLNRERHECYMFKTAIKCDSHIPYFVLINMTDTVKLLNNGQPFCRGLVAVVDECPLVRGCGKKCQQTHVCGEVKVV